MKEHKKTIENSLPKIKEFQKNFDQLFPIFALINRMDNDGYSDIFAFIGQLKSMDDETTEMIERRIIK